MPVEFAPYFMALVALCFIGAGARQLYQTWRFVRGADRAQGVVVGFRTRWSRGSAVDCPVVRYRPAWGGAIEFESPIGSRPRLHREGQVVTVLYHSDHPERARLDSGCLLWALPIGFIVLGLWVLAFAVFGVLLTQFVARLPT